MSRNPTPLPQLTRMRKKYLQDSTNKLRKLNDKITALEAEVRPFMEKVHQLDKLYCCLHKEQRRFDKLRELLAH